MSTTLEPTESETASAGGARPEEPTQSASRRTGPHRSEKNENGEGRPATLPAGLHGYG